MRYRGFEQEAVYDGIVRIDREDYDRAFDNTSNPEELRQKVHLDWGLTQQGRPLGEVLEGFFSFVNATPLPMLGQHIRSLDLTFLQVASAQLWPGESLRLPLERSVDVGLCVKAAQLGRTIDPGESPDDYMKSVNGTRQAGVYWSTQYICEQFELDVDPDALHGAVTDARVLAYIVEFVLRQGMTEERKQHWLTSLGNSSSGISPSTSA